MLSLRIPWTETVTTRQVSRKAGTRKRILTFRMRQPEFQRHVKKKVGRENKTEKILNIRK